MASQDYKLREKPIAKCIKYRKLISMSINQLRSYLSIKYRKDRLIYLTVDELAELEIHLRQKYYQQQAVEFE
jgi:hypothetical protein